MANEREIIIKISADGTAAIAGIRNVGESISKLGTSGSMLDTLKNNWVGLAAGVTAAYMSVVKYVEFASDSAKFQNQMKNLDSLGAKYALTAEEITSRMTAASRGLMGMEEAASLAAKQMLAGLSPTQIENMTALAERLSKVWGVSVADAYETVGRAAMTGRDRMLRSSGVLIDMKAAHEQYARAMNVTTSMLDAETKMMIGMQEVARRTPEILAQLAKPAESAASGFGRLRVVILDLKEDLGKVFLQVLGGGYAAMREYPVASAAMAAGLVALGVAASATAATVALTFVPAVKAATAAVWASTVAMMKNPVVLAFAAAVMAAAGAFAYFKGKAKEAEDANNAFQKSLRAEGLEKTTQVVEDMEAALTTYKTRLAEARAESDAMARPKFGEQVSNDFRAAAEETAYWAKMVKDLETKLAGAKKAQAELTSAATEETKRLNKEREKIRKDQADAEADRARKEREGIERNLRDQIAKSGQGPVGRIAEIEAEAALMREKGVKETLVAEWVASQKVRAAEKARIEIDKFAAGTTKNELAELDEQLAAFRRAGATEEDIKRARAAGMAQIAKGYTDKLIEESQRALEIRQANEKTMDDAILVSNIERRKAEQAAAEASAAAQGADASTVIQQKAAHEREILNMKIASIDATNRDNLNLSQSVALDAERLQLLAGIEAIKTKEANDLDIRRMELQREITDLTRQQADILREQGQAQIAKAFTDLGSPGIGQAYNDMANAQQGLEVGPAMGSDVYSQGYQAWAAVQDQKIMAMEEARNLEMARLRAQGMEEAAIIEETETRKAEIRAAYNEYSVQADQTTNQQRVAVVQGYLGMAAGLMEAANSATKGKNKALFNAMKATQIASALISTFSGAAAALAPPPLGLGPIAGIPLAAITVATGLMRIASIQSQKFEGGSASGGSGSMSVPSYSAPSLPSSPTMEKQAAASPIVNFYISGDVVDHDQFARSIVPYINKAVEAGVV